MSKHRSRAKRKTERQPAESTDSVFDDLTSTAAGPPLTTADVAAAIAKLPPPLTSHVRPFRIDGKLYHIDRQMWDELARIPKSMVAERLLEAVRSGRLRRWYVEMAMNWPYGVLPWPNGRPMNRSSR